MPGNILIQQENSVPVTDPCPPLRYQCGHYLLPRRPHANIYIQWHSGVRAGHKSCTVAGPWKLHRASWLTIRIQTNSFARRPSTLYPIWSPDGFEYRFESSDTDSSSDFSKGKQFWYCIGIVCSCDGSAIVHLYNTPFSLVQ